jgi:hypothetical protein
VSVLLSKLGSTIVVAESIIGVASVVILKAVDCFASYSQVLAFNASHFTIA